MAVTFGLDISHHQDAALDLARARSEGIEFVILKATEGADWNDPEFAANLNEARAAGLLVAAYHYQRSNVTAAAQVANVRDSVPLDVPVVLDVETNSGGVALTRDLVAGLRAAGYSVPLTYIPRWYWNEIGSPSLAGLPPLWSSRYPDNIIGTLSDEWADVPAHYWDGYGGLDVAVLQFTSSVRIAGHQPIDANAFRGTRAELAALLEDDMPLTPADTNAVWMQPCTGTGPDGTTQTWPAATWMTVMAFRIAALSNTVAEIQAAQATPPQVEIDYDRIVTDVVDKLATRLGALRFDAEPNS
jgi:lysozyme